MIWQAIATWWISQPYFIANYWLVQVEPNECKKENGLGETEGVAKKEQLLLFQNVGTWKGQTIDLHNGYLNSWGSIQLICS